MNSLQLALSTMNSLTLTQSFGVLLSQTRFFAGIGAMITAWILFKPLIKGVLQALWLSVFPKHDREERSAQRTLRDVLTIRRMAREAEEFSPSMAAELRSLAARA